MPRLIEIVLFLAPFIGFARMAAGVSLAGAAALAGRAGWSASLW